jgi:uncharacterized protein YggE
MMSTAAQSRTATNPMRFIAAAGALAALLAASALPAAAAERTIAVTGEARVQARPDIAVIELGVTRDAATAKAAFDDAAGAMRKVTDALAAAGIDERDRQTTTIAIFPRYGEAAPGVAPAVEGFTARTSVSIRARDIAAVGGLLDAATGAGANEIGGITFAIDDDKALRDGARTAAVIEARRKAELYAAAAGVRLGKVLAIDEHGDAPVGQPMMKFAAAPAADSMPVEPGEISLGETVAVTFALEGGE